MRKQARVFVSLLGVALAVCLLGGPTGAQQSSEPQASGAAKAQPVAAIRIVSEEGAVIEENPAGLTGLIGKPYDPEAIRESLRALYRTGRYADLRAETSPVAAGVRLDFVVRENFFTNLVRIKGLHEPPTEGQALVSLALNPGEIFRQTTLDSALERLRETLREDGLYQARVSSELHPVPETRQMDILVTVAPGPRARFGKITLRNHTEFPDEDLADRLGLRSGRELTSARLKATTGRIRDFLVKKEHLSGRVTIHRGEYDAASNRLTLEIEVSAGPKVRVQVEGAKISGKQLRRLLPMYSEGAVDEDLLQEGRRSIRDHLEGEGYFDAQVSYATSEKAGEETPRGVTPPLLIITYRVDRGVRHRLVGIEIEGNHYFSDELLRSRLTVQKTEFAARARFSRRILQNDALAIHDLYVNNGFRDALAKDDVTDNYKGKEGNVFVRFRVDEGPQSRVANLVLEGNHALSNETLLGVIGSTPGQPFSEFDLATDRDNILALYYNEGFPEARFSSSVEESAPPQAPSASNPAAQNGVSAHNHSSQAKLSSPRPEGPRAGPAVRLTYHIVEGPRITARRVLIGGYEHTRLGVIRREVKVAPHEPLRQGDVVETQRRLYNLGIFSHVSIAPQNPAGTDTDKTVVVLVDEAKRYTLAYGGGIEVQRLASTSNPAGSAFQASPRGIFEIGKSNLTGRADSLSLKLRASTLQYRALLGYTAPNFFGKQNFSLQLTSFADKTQDINTFTSTRYEGSVQLAERLTPFSSFLYRYAFRKVLVSSLNVTPQEIPLFSQPTLVSEFGITWFRDRRNNPADADRGNFNNVDLSAASSTIGSSASFVRLFYQNSSFHPVRRGFTIARSIRLGVLEPFQDTVSLQFPQPTTPPLPIVIPLPERFFAGGGTTLRSFALNQAGPRDPVTGFPVGGQALVVLNQELRFPMRLPLIGTRLSGALFYDAGNVFSRVDRITLRWAPPKPVFNPANLQACLLNCTNELNYFSHTVGLGFRYATPIGPVRIDLGYQLNPATFVIPCTGGVANCQQSTTLPRFQIFFNLGSIF
jgi:outer membrane protein insertion porin family